MDGSRCTIDRKGQGREGGPGSGRTATGSGGADAVIRALAARQHGVVARRQLLREGISRDVIDYRVRRRRLQPLYRGVYRVGPVATPREAEMAALLACGPTSVLSHRTAARIWEMLPSGKGRIPVEVTIRRGRRAPGSGVLVHRASTLDDTDVTTADGLSLTVPGRTLLDLATVTSPRTLEQALAAADRSGLLDRQEMAALVARSLSRPGRGMLAEILGREAAPAFTRSEAESTFLKLVRRAKLARPRTNVVVERYEVDFLWQASRLVVEIDGFAYHSSSTAFERDRARDAVLTAAGFRVMRVTWRQLTRQPEALLVRLAQALAKPAPPAGS